MQRRTMVTLAGLATLGALGRAAHASVADLTQGDAASGVRAALERGAAVAVETLGQPGGFLDNPKLRIPLPGMLEQAAKLARYTGQQQRVDDLVTAMNRAAEAAVPQAKTLLVGAVKSMSVSDARGILTGGDQAATAFFSRTTRAPLSARFLPIVTKATEKVDLADRYNALAGKASALGIVGGDDANLQKYVTGKALDALYTVIGEEERKIRQDPVGTGSALLQKVFGAVR